VINETVGENNQLALTYVWGCLVHRLEDVSEYFSCTLHADLHGKMAISEEAVNFDEGKTDRDLRHRRRRCRRLQRHRGSACWGPRELHACEFKITSLSMRS
jgi:hypothetical protein